jgi:hypothetical protein
MNSATRGMSISTPSIATSLGIFLGFWTAAPNVRISDNRLGEKQWPGADGGF